MVFYQKKILFYFNPISLSHLLVLVLREQRLDTWPRVRLRPGKVSNLVRFKITHRTPVTLRTFLNLDIQVYQEIVVVKLFGL